MKPFINLILFVAAFAGAFTTYAQPDNDADPALASFGFQQSPVTVGSTTHLLLNVTNNAFTYPVPAGAIAILVSLPVSSSYTASPASTASISGAFASNFTWTYTSNGSTNSLRGVLNTAIPAGTGGIISFNVIGVTNTNSSQVISTANIQRLNPGLIPNEDVTNNLLSAGLAVSPSPLPVNMAGFTASKNECMAHLSWVTSNEENTSYFEVETSNDGKLYKSIGSVKAAGKSTDRKYYSYDYQMQSGAEYLFRLKMVDLNGEFSYTPVLKLNCGITGVHEVTVAPNPVMNIAHINGMTRGNNIITVLDVKGRKVQSLTTQNVSVDVDVANFAPGIYTIRIEQENGDIVTRKLVKQ